MSATVVRVKRRLNEDPVNALVLSYKRRKTAENTENDDGQALLTLAATVKENNLEAVRKVLTKTKDELEASFKLHKPDITAKQRAANLSKSKENRFKILSCNRSSNLTEESLEVEPITIVDVTMFDDVTAEEETCDAPLEYVYDLYSTDFMPEEDDINDGYFQSLVSVEPFVMQYRGSEDSDEIDPYDEDSNEENNWKNDYPDSDNSIDEDDMRLAASLKGMGLDNGVDLSSDSEDERYAEEGGSRGFEAYKQKILKENFVDVIDSDGSEYEGDYYGCVVDDENNSDTFEYHND